jgi:nitroreductase
MKANTTCMPSEPTPVMDVSSPFDRDDASAPRLLNVLANRRSFALKDITTDPVDRTLIAQLLEAANWAPSHGKTEPWRFVVYSDAARQELSDAFGVAFRALNPVQSAGSPGELAQSQRVWQAPVWIALGMQPSQKMPEWEDLIAFGSAVQNMHLMASALGLASKWTSGAVVLHPSVATVVGFAPDTKLYGFFYVGHPAIAWPTGQRRPIAEKVRWVDDSTDTK